MKRVTRPAVGIAVVAIAVLSIVAAAAAHGTKGTSGASIPSFSANDLNALPGNDWITAQGNLSGQRSSSLTTVTPANVHGLQLAWHVKLAAKRPKGQDPLLTLAGEASQVEYQGTVYSEDEYGRVYALDAKTGKRLWYYEPHNPTPSIPTKFRKNNTFGLTVVGPWASARGVALGDGMVFVEELLGKIVAINASTGKAVWTHQIAPVARSVGLSQAPVYYNGMLIGSTSSGDTGFPCFAFALDAKTGKLLWKFNVIPQSATDPAWKTWAHPLAFNGGGAMWSTPSIDSQNGIAYFAVGNPIPYMGLLRGPGQEWYTDGVLALDVTTGKFRWFYQEVHHDIWDADQSQQPMLFDLTYQGQKRQAVVSADKDGLWYVLDRVTGKPIIPVTEMKVQQSKESHTWATQPIPATTPLVPQTVPDPKKWKGLKAPDGKPYNIGSGPAGSFTAIDSRRYSVTAAFGQGASGNKPASVDQSKGLLIEETTPGFLAMRALPLSETGKMGYFNFGWVGDMKMGPLNSTPAASVTGTRLEAMDLATGKMVWKVDHLTSANKNSGRPGGTGSVSNAFGGGVMTTPGIVWTTSHNALQAYDESNGKLLWSSHTLKSPVFSPPSTYSVGGKQYVTIFCSSTGDLYAFAA